MFGERMMTLMVRAQPTGIEELGFAKVIPGGYPEVFISPGFDSFEERFSAARG